MENEWVAEIFFSHGTSNSKGVTILIPQKLGLEVKISKIFHDQEKMEQDNFLENLNELIIVTEI